MIRILPGHVIESEKIVDLGYNSWYLAGCTDSYVYFGNTTAARRVIQVELSNGDTTQFILAIPSLNTYHFQSVQIKIDSPYIYLMDGTIPVIFRGTLHNTEMTPLDLPLSHYDQCVPTGPASFGLRIFNNDINGNSLAKITLLPSDNSTRPHNRRLAKEDDIQNFLPGDRSQLRSNFELYSKLLEKQTDGLFSVDGMFHYDKSSARFVYLYFYRNEYLYLDSSLTLQYRGKTIDTTRYVNIKTDTLHAQHSITMSAPPVFVNKQSAISRQWLFVLSDKLAKNESIKIHEENEVIDVYSLANGKYQFSFYISPLRKTRMKGFIVTNDKFVALYDQYLVIRELNQKYFDDTNLSL